MAVDHTLTESTEDILQPASAQPMSTRQRVFLRYFTAILIDLVVLNLFVEYWRHVVIDSFTVSLFAAVVLQVLLRATIALEHQLATFFNARQGGFNRFMRFFSAWLVLFGSKFVILWALDVTFGTAVEFGGPVHGVVALIVVLLAMVIAEELIVRFYRRLA